MSDNVNVSSAEFQSVARKLAAYVRQVTENVMMDEGVIENLTDYVFDQVIEVDTTPSYISNEEEDQQILDKIKAQFPMLEDE